MQIAGKVALITGGARGLGRAFAEALLKKGAKVCVCDVNVEQGKITEEELQSQYDKNTVIFAKCDVTNQREFGDVFKKVKSTFGRLDITVNNAGVVGEGKNQWRRTIEINLVGVLTGTMLAIEHMRKDLGGHGGTIINIASTAGVTPVFFTPVYAASKHGVVGFTRSWADNPDVDRYGLKFVCLCPAFTDTDMVKSGMNGTLDPNHNELADMAIKAIGINSVQSVSDAFMELVENEGTNGAVMTVTTKHGQQYKYQQRRRTSKL